MFGVVSPLFIQLFPRGLRRNEMLRCFSESIKWLELGGWGVGVGVTSGRRCSALFPVKGSHWPWRLCCRGCGPLCPGHTLVRCLDVCKTWAAQPSSVQISKAWRGSHGCITILLASPAHLEGSSQKTPPHPGLNSIL